MSKSKIVLGTVQFGLQYGPKKFLEDALIKVRILK